MTYLPDLPNEIFTQILTFLSLYDQKTCTAVSHAWHRRFEPLVLSSIYLKTRQQFKQFFSKLQHSHTTFGLLIRRLTLGPFVGMSNSEFSQLPLYCPFLEYLEFNSLLWKYFKYTENLVKWSYLCRFPCMRYTQMTVPILCSTGRNITQLEMSACIVDELLSTQFTIFSILKHTPNLLSLKLQNGISIFQNVSISEFESIHNLCPGLEELQLKTFDAHLLAKDGYSVDIDTLPVAANLKTLSLDMAINSERYLTYWAHKYPCIENINIQLRLLETEYYHDEPILSSEKLQMKECFALMAKKFVKLKKMEARFDEKCLPCDVFLHGLNSIGAQIEELSIHFYDFDYHRRSARNFKLLIQNSVNTIKSIKISNWDRSWDYEEDILEPIGQCVLLKSLSLSPQPGALTEVDMDVILDHCTYLKQLELSNAYNLFIDNHHVSTESLHRLEELTLQHTMVNNELFDYLAIRCPYLNKLDISNVIKPYDNSIQVKIRMPHHVFKSIRIANVFLGLRMEDSGFQCFTSSTIFSLEETDKTSSAERWYHLYQPTLKHYSVINRHMKCKEKNTPKPRLQRFRENNQIEKIKGLKMTRQLWERISSSGLRFKNEPKDRWELDIPYGFFSVQCKSVNQFEFEQVTL